MDANVTVEVKPKETQKPKLTVDPATAITIFGILSKIPMSELLKGLLLKIFIFAFGIFCGIGIVYKSGLPTDTPPVVDVSSYQKRIEELQTENAALRQVHPTIKSVEPAVLPFPKTVVPTPSVNPSKNGFVVK